MSKEWLEDMERQYLDSEGNKPIWGGFTLTAQTLNEIIKFAKEQAERVQELEEDNENLQTLSRINRKESIRLHEQNKSYRKTLEFYADEEIYGTTSTTPPTNGYQQPIKPVFKTVPIVYYDRGNTARKALESESE